MIIKGIFRLILLLYSSPLPQYSADYAPSSPSIPYQIYSSHHKPHTSHRHKPPLISPQNSCFLTPLIISSDLVGTAPYRAVTAATAIEHPHPDRTVDAFIPSYNKIPGTENSHPYPRAGPFVHPSSMPSVP